MIRLLFWLDRMLRRYHHPVQPLSDWLDRYMMREIEPW